MPRLFRNACLGSYVVLSWVIIRDTLISRNRVCGAGISGLNHTFSTIQKMGMASLVLTGYNLVKGRK